MRRLAAAIPRALLLFALFSCTSDTTGPAAIQHAQLSLAPGLDRAILAQVGVARVLVRFTRTDGSKALETVVAFPAGSDTLTLALSVPLIGVVEDFALTLILIDDPAADTVFRSGPTPVTLRAGLTQSTVSVPAFIYVGTGANATGVRLVNKPASVAFGQTATFTAEAFDASGTTIPNTPILWSSSDPAKASVPNRAVGAVIGGTTRGSVSVTASLLQTVVNTPPPSVSSTLIIQPVASALVAQGGAGQTGPVGAALAQPLRVRVNAVDNLGVQGVPVSFTVTSGGGSLSSAQVLTDVNGDASVVWTLGGAVGAQVVSAVVTGVAGAGGTQTFAASGVAGAASMLAFTTQPSAVNAGVAISPAVVVEAQDSFGNRATAFTGVITLALGNSPAGATLGGTATVTAVNGVARFGDLTVSAVGTNMTLGAASNGLTGATSAPFSVSAGAAATLAFTTQPSSGTAGTAIAPSIVVTARDASGSTATSFVGAVLLALGTNPAGGVLSGTTTVNAVGGVATFSGVTLTKAAAGNTLSATATGLASVTSSAFTIAPAAASALAFTTQPVTSGAGAVITPPVGVTALDAFGNVATAFTGNVVITIGTNPGGAALLGTTTVAAVNGVASFSNLSLTARGTGYTLAAAAAGTTGATSAAFDIAATTLAWTNPSGGLWSNPSNWSLGRVPQSADSVLIAQPGTYTVTLDTTFSGSVITLGGGSGTQTLALSSRTLTISGTMTVKANGVFSTTNSTIAGAGVLVNQGLLNLKATNVAATGGLDNQATFIANAAVNISGPLTTSAASILRLLADGTTGFSTFTSANSFTNNGLIELTTAGAGYSATLAVAGSSTLTNAPGGTITALVGAGGPRTIDAQLVNQGTLTIAQPLTLAHASAAHTNSGTIDASAADFTLNQTGTTPSFTNTGTVTLGAGRTWAINGGALNLNAGTISGAGTLSLNGLTANFATNVTNATTGFVATNVTINGPGTLTNASGLTMSLKAVTIGATSGLNNQGTLIANAAVTVNGTVTTSAGSTLRLLADGTTGFSTFTSANSFTNNGLIELTTAGAGYSPTLAVSGSSTLTNAAGGTITALVGAGGPRTIDAQLVNQGTLTIAQALTLAHASAAHTNSGTIDASAGNLTVNQTGTAPSFSNSGTISVGASRVLAINGGTFTQGGVLNGSGGVALTNVATTFNSPVTVSSLDVSGGSVAFASNQNTGGLATSLINTVVNGPGSLTNSAGQTLSIRSATFNNSLINRGTLITDGVSGVAAASTFSTDTGSTLRLLATGATGNSTFTVPAFTNLGAIEMTTSTAAYTTVLNVSGSGILTNASTGTISSLIGTGGSRTISAQLVNQGLITINQPLVLNRAASAHSNAGTIAANADFTVTQSGVPGGPPASFDNTGAISVGAGRTLFVNGGSFTTGTSTSGSFATGTLSGPGTLTLNGTNASFNRPFSLPALNVTGGAVFFSGSQTTAGITMNLVNTSVSGTGLINSAGQTLTLRSVAFNTALQNQGLVITDGATSVTGPNSFFSNDTGSTLLIQATGATGNSTFSVPSFANAGAINMTTLTAAYTDVLTVGGGTGTLTNNAGAFITILAGTGGSRTINGNLANQGTVIVKPGPSPAGTLQVNGGFTHTGALNLEIGGLAASTGYSRVSVSGTATLRGTLNYSLVNNYTPTKGDPFDILTASSVAGTFTIGTQPVGWAAPTYSATLVRLTAP